MDEQLKRRSSDHMMQSLVSSPWAKIVGVILQGIMALGFTAISVVSSGILSKLNTIDATLNVLITSKALTESDLKQLQAFRAQMEARDITLRERVTTVEAEVRNLKDRRP